MIRKGPIEIKMAITTSLEDSGIIEVLTDAFYQAFKIRVRAIAVGSGQALELAKNGDVDLIFTHTPSLEEEYERKGIVIERKGIMSNDFVIVGPPADIGGVRNSKNVDSAFTRIADVQAKFISRGDNSGTHIKEMEIWKKIKISPQEKHWYIESGQGMGLTLNIADEKGGYCLIDRATFLTFKNRLVVRMLFEGDPTLHNIYHIMAVNPAKYPYVRYKETKLFIEWLRSRQAEQIINNFRKNGERLFVFIPD